MNSFTNSCGSDPIAGTRKKREHDQQREAELFKSLGYTIQYMEPNFSQFSHPETHQTYVHCYHDTISNWQEYPYAEKARDLMQAATILFEDLEWNLPFHALTWVPNVDSFVTMSWKEHVPDPVYDAELNYESLHTHVWNNQGRFQHYRAIHHAVDFDMQKTFYEPFVTPEYMHSHIAISTHNSLTALNDYYRVDRESGNSPLV